MACERECECGSVCVRACCACVRASVCVCEQISTCYIPDGDGSTTICNTLEIAVECVELLDCVQCSRHAFSACSVQLHAPLAPLQRSSKEAVRGRERLEKGDEEFLLADASRLGVPAWELDLVPAWLQW